jgi:hypothetical protein
MNRLVTQPMECEAGAVAPDDLGLLNRIMRLQAEPLYLVLQELMHALPDRLHCLASAWYPQRSLVAGLEQELGNRPGLDAGPASIKDLVAVRLTQEGQLTGKPNIDIWHYFSVSKNLRLTLGVQPEAPTQGSPAEKLLPGPSDSDSVSVSSKEPVSVFAFRLPGSDIREYLSSCPNS